MNQPFNVIKASQLAGVFLDCDLSTGLKIGGGTATDNTAAINALLATASETNPIKLIIDGGTTTTGIIIATAGYTEIEGIGWSSGFYIKSGSNADPINNGAIILPTPPTTPPASGSYIRLANFMINGNRGNGTTGNSTSGNPRGASNYWYCNINLYNINSIRIENIYSYDSAAYSLRFNNCSDVIVEKCRILNPNVTAGGNQDCVHVDGPATDIRILNNYLNNNFSDDGLAINAPEGYAGPMTRVVVTGNTFLDTNSAIRIYGGASAAIGQLIFSNNTGTVLDVGINFGGGDIGPQDTSGQAIDISNNIFYIGNGPFMGIDSDMGDLNISDCIWNSPQAASVQGLVVCGGASLSISSLTVNNCSIYRSTSGSATNTPLLINNGGTTTIKRMTIDGFAILDEAGQSYTAITSLLAMTNIAITDLFVASLNYTNITAFADSYANITSLHGAFQPETNIQSVTGAYTTLPTDRTVLASTTAGSFAVAVPATLYKGAKYTYKNTGTANTLTITGTIDGSANPTLATEAFMTVLYDGTALRKIG